MKVENRFLKYVRFGTNSSEKSTTVPSTMCQKELTDYLEQEMKDVGLSDVFNDGNGYVYGTLPASQGCEDMTAIGLIAHIDTSEAVPGDNIKPKIVHYQGGDITLDCGVITAESTFPVLKIYRGQHLIVTDGTTLLGADDKAGIAEIMCAVEYLINNPDIQHGKVYMCFNPDEEIGKGMAGIDLGYFDPEYAYTVDGGKLGELQYECFNAAAAKITVKGINIHPGTAKNRMKNAVLYANEFISMLPPAETPSHTEKYEGFYHVNGISGNESEVKLSIIVRDHNKDLFNKRKQFIVGIADYLNNKYGEGTFSVTLSDTYYNMREKIEHKMYIVERVIKAMEKLHIEPIIIPVRGGTDGAALSFMGLPCPNICSGVENAHGVNEFVSVETMESIVKLLVNVICMC